MVCPAAHYCPANASKPLPCPSHHVCPWNSAGPLPCPWYSVCHDGQTTPWLWQTLAVLAMLLGALCLRRRKLVGRVDTLPRKPLGPVITLASVGGKRGVTAATAVCHPCEITAVIGASGCGKSTLVQMVAGRMPMQHGEVRVASQCRLPTVVIAGQDDIVPNLTALECVQYAAAVATPLPCAGVAEAQIEHLGLASVANKRTTMLSGGQRKRVSIAMALAAAVAGPCELLILDECTAACDSRAELVVLAAARRAVIQARCAGLVVLHRPSAEAIDYVDYIACLSPSGATAQFTMAKHAVALCRVNGHTLHRANPLDCLIDAADGFVADVEPLSRPRPAPGKRESAKQWKHAVLRHLRQMRVDTCALVVTHAVGAVVGLVIGIAYTEKGDVHHPPQIIDMPAFSTMLGLAIATLTGLVLINRIGPAALADREAGMRGPVRHIITVDGVNAVHTVFLLPCFVTATAWVGPKLMQPFAPAMGAAFALAFASTGFALLAARAGSLGPMLFVGVMLFSAVLSTAHPTLNEMTATTRAVSAVLPVRHFVQALSAAQLHQLPQEVWPYHDYLERRLGFDVDFEGPILRMLAIGLATRLVMYFGLCVLKR